MMTIKNMQFVVTVPVDVPADWELPDDFPTVVENVDILREMKALVLGAKVNSIGDPFVVLETITD